MRGVLLAAAIGLASVSAAPLAAQQATAAPAVSSVDPARLTAAKALMNVLMPPDTRQQMVRGMMEPLLANIRQGMTSNPSFAKAIGDNPKFAAAFDAFIAQQNARTMSIMAGTLPQMIDAMSHAYARRFDVAQLAEIERFFHTPTGRAYMQASMTIMSDPDIAAWQRTMMGTAMSQIQNDAAAFGRKIATIQQGETK